MKPTRAVWCMFAAVSACSSPQVEAPKNEVTQQTSVRVAENVKNKVDILFMIDNSSSMKAKQDQLRAEFPQLINVLQNFGEQGTPASYHIGVVTSDLGAAPYVDAGCKIGGDGGRLQIRGAAADASCKNVTGGVNFIDYNQITGVNNLPDGQDIQTTFGCMAAVGDKGCGFEHQLESPYVALTDKSIAQNNEFLRDDAILAVVFVTDEDDCTGAPGTDLYNKLPSTAPPDGLGLLDSYRCNNFGIVCTDPMTGMPALMPYGSSGGPLVDCRPATLEDDPKGKLTDVKRYVDLFTKKQTEGGIKIDPNDVILIAIAADPASGVATVIANPSPDAQDADGQQLLCDGPLGMNCAVQVKHSCVTPSDHRFFGDPAVRIKNVVSQAANQAFKSICDVGDYAAALEDLASLILINIKPGCLNAPLARPNDPECVVEDVQTMGDGTENILPIQSCDKTGGAFPCWEAKSSDQCPPIYNPLDDKYEQLGVVIERGPGGQPPPHTFARVFCSTIALAPSDMGPPQDSN